MMSDNGSFAEYAVVPDWTTFHIPNNVSFEEAATIPLAALTAVVGLYGDVKIPQPFGATHPKDGAKYPIVIYGVGSAVGAFGAQLARLSGLYPIIGVAGKSGDFAKGLVDYVVDYRDGEDAVVNGIKAALKKEGLPETVKQAFDAISEKGSFEALARVIDPEGGFVSHVLPPPKDLKYPGNAQAVRTSVGQSHSEQKELAYVWSRYLARLLAEGKFKPHPHEVIPGGLDGVSTGLNNLKNNKANAVKYVFRIGETKSAGANI
jgi:NADPH2:quinone reductase